MALHYPRGMEQYGADGKERYLLLHTNLYGGTDASYRWDSKRNRTYKERYTRPGWNFIQSYMDPCLFRIERTLASMDYIYVEGDDNLQPETVEQGDMEVDSWALMLVHSDDHDLVGTSTIS